MKYLIWCYERGMWWKPNSNGYTTNLHEAGRYSEEEATQIVNNANIIRREEALVPESNAMGFNGE